MIKSLNKVPTSIVYPKEEVNDEEIDGPGRYWNGISENCSLLNPWRFTGTEVPARYAKLFPLELNPIPSLFEIFSPLLSDWNSICVVPITPATVKHKLQLSKTLNYIVL